MSEQQNDAMSRLTEEARVKGRSRMIPDATKASDVTRAQAQGVFTLINQYRQRTGSTAAAIAKSIGISSPTLSQTLADKYPGNWQQIAIDLDHWLEGQLARDANQMPSEFCWTSVAKEIQTVADMACTLKTIGLVYGPSTSGIGKTMALRAIAAEKPGSIFVSTTTPLNSASGLLMSIARVMKMDLCGNTMFAFHKMCQILKDTPRLLIIDEIHKLMDAKGDKPLHVLRDLFDSTGAPQLWSGTSDLVSYLERAEGSKREPLAQIRRRIGICRDLLQRTRDGSDGPGEPLFTVDEIRQVFGKFQMRLAPDSARYLCHLACLPDSGGLGFCRNLMLIAVKVYGARENILTASMLRASHKLLVSRRMFDAMETRVSEYDAPLSIAKAG